MNTIKVVYNRDKVLLDENNEIITYQMLPSSVTRLFNEGMNGYDMEYYQEVYDSYFIKKLAEETYFYGDPEITYQEFRFVTACYLKAELPETKILFKNNNYYDFPIDNQGFSEIPKDFDISSMILSKGKKELKVMFDYESTGMWDYEGKSIPIDWIPVSQATRNLITQFQKGLNSMRIDYDNDYTKEENEEADSYMLIGLKGAIALKNELPEWNIYFYNYGQYFDLPIMDKGHDYSNCSEITKYLIAKKIAVNTIHQ